ncbi:MAG: APC family permease [Arenicella sp.]|nr:APC family permease [Arenicella sp.]
MNPHSNARNLKREIGFIGASFLVLNSMIGAGIFALPGKVAVNAGLLSPWLFLIVGALFLTVVLTFAELASYYKTTGGPVLYATDAFGPLAGFSTGWAIFLSRMTAFAANANVLATYIGTQHESMATDMARWIIISSVTFGLTWANVVGVRDGVRTMGIFTVLKVVPLLLLVALGLQHVTATTLIPESLFVPNELGATTLLLIYAYVGFETVAVTAGETSKPRRTLPRALVGTVLATGMLYFLIVLVFVSVVPSDDYGDATLVVVGQTLAGSFGALAITLAAVFSIGGNLAGSMLAAPRLIFSMAEKRMLPGWLGHVHPKHATPDYSIFLMAAMALVLALSGSFVILAVASSVVRLLGFMICIAALPAVRRNADQETHARAYRLKGGYTIPIVAFLICVWLTMQSKADSWIVVSTLLIIGWLLYLLEKYVQSRG